jgi:acyl-CoA synthetase (AMP-forming)/AMP-acid ligase II
MSRVADRLARVAAKQPDAIALLEWNGRRTSYAALTARVTHIREALMRHGVRPGDRALFAVRPSETAIASILAINALDAVIAAAPIGAGDTLFRAQMQLLHPEWVLAESVLLAAMNSRVVRRLVEWKGGLLPSLAALGEAHTPMHSNRGGTADEPGEEAEAFIVFTSGTTSAPKAVVHTRRSLTVMLDLISERLALAPGDRLYARDLHLVLPALFAGALAYIPSSGAYHAARTATELAERGITHLFEVTANLEKLVDHLERTGGRLPSSLRCVMVGAAPVRRAFFSRLQAVMAPDAVAWCVYGMTEVLPVATISLADKLAYDGDGDIVGAPVRGVRATVSETGELVVSAPHLFAGYLGAAPVTAHHTGDLVRLEGGRIVLLGRAKDMIIRREYNIYPELHEPVIERIPGVVRCAMVGIFDERAADERVVLLVEPDDLTLDALGRQALATRVRLALQTGPHRIDEAAMPDDILVAAVPMSGRSQKVDKAKVRDMARAMLRATPRAPASAPTVRVP